MMNNSDYRGGGIRLYTVRVSRTGQDILSSSLSTTRMEVMVARKSQNYKDLDLRFQAEMGIRVCKSWHVHISAMIKAIFCFEKKK